MLGAALWQLGWKLRTDAMCVWEIYLAQPTSVSLTYSFTDPKFCVSMFALCRMLSTLQWRNNGYSGILNHQLHDWLFNCSFRRRSKKTSKPRVTGLCAGNSQHKWPGTQKMFPFDDIIMSFWFGNLTWPKFVHRVWVIGENVANVFYCLKWQSLVFLLCYAFLHWEFIIIYSVTDKQWF